MSEIRERRAHPRVDLLAQVQLSRDTEVHIMSTRDISLGGVFVRGEATDHPELKIGAMVELVIFDSSAASGGDDIGLRATITRIEKAPDPGFALRFINAGPSERAALQRLIDSATKAR
jgi:c-di-GMP-binding flagellar brake protein YcgR